MLDGLHAVLSTAIALRERKSLESLLDTRDFSSLLLDERPRGTPKYISGKLVRRKTHLSGTSTCVRGFLGALGLATRRGFNASRTSRPRGLQSQFEVP